MLFDITGRTSNNYIAHIIRSTSGQWNDVLYVVKIGNPYRAVVASLALSLILSLYIMPSISARSALIASPPSVGCNPTMLSSLRNMTKLILLIVFPTLIFMPTIVSYTDLSVFRHIFYAVYLIILLLFALVLRSMAIIIGSFSPLFSIQSRTRLALTVKAILSVFSGREVLKGSGKKLPASRTLFLRGIIHALNHLLDTLLLFVVRVVRWTTFSAWEATPSLDNLYYIILLLALKAEA